ncbi:N-acetyltransferase [Krasilnikoviella flava]|uniref:hypothetical protein n=1 Tax=Krasilnikoviella flava TaxID=526729 RepID=UPI001591292A|nr:hypothetical protein [Krasilnikoviella flava]
MISVRRATTLDVGAIHLQLSIAWDNTRAQSLYEAEGFEREREFVTYRLPLG